MMDKLRAIDLFAGIGGIRLGFEQAFGESSIETVFASEFDKHAVKTYSANFATPVNRLPDKEDSLVMTTNPYIYGDITKVDERDIPEFEVCLAGFPCQAFSIAGRKHGFDDDYKGMSRGTLFFDVARICDYHKPKIIFCENVKGLTIHDRGNTIKVIEGVFHELGYTLYSKVLNSKNFGVPQNRERIYMVAFRNDIDSSTFKFPTHAGRRRTIQDIMETDIPSTKYYLSTTYLESLRRHKARHQAKGNGFGYVIRDTNDIAGAIVCGGMGRERNLIIDDRLEDFTPVTHIKGEVNHEGVRKMTPREWARLQGYPDSYDLSVVCDGHLYRQLGNSVSVPVIRAIAKRIKGVLDAN